MIAGQLAFDLSVPLVRERFSRKARQIRIEVRAGGEILLVIPRGASRAQAHAFLRERDAWVQRMLRKWRPVALAPAVREDSSAGRKRAREVAAQLLAEESPRLGLTPSRLRIGDPKTLWGSCSAIGTISLSWRLVMAPPDVFRYVVIHELCHLRYRSHGPRFWGLVERFMPGFEQHRRWLREHGAQLHAMLPAHS